ncbi:glycosyltransferase family 2 protein [Flavobacterium phragmitis]|uniref:Glycosyl transferase family 2 n=1 Tax=Flavobacterium phragmitis TaxID=739143 RepID=A0A1I1NSG8_9FLAO|nr:glycosyltransferase [Flavobacterium phragmitis]SFD00614.1 Glycosyl transferase family 2 [Flavobacterium phragmitis]
MSNNNPIVSVLMPVYNGEKYLKEAIDSVLKQTYNDFEFIIINDGSSDQTETIILSYNDSRIKYVKNKINLGLIKTLNCGIELARGKYIARMDADDIAMLDRFEKQINKFISHSEIQMVNCKCLLLNEKGDKYRKNRTNITVNYQAIKYISIFESMIVHPGIMIETSIMKQFKYRDEPNTAYVEDFELWNRLFANNIRCYTIEEPLIFYRINSESITNTKGHEQKERIKRITQSILKQYDVIIDNKILDLILEDFHHCNYKLLKKMDSDISNFFISLLNKDLVSKAGYNDMVMWKNFKLLFVSIKSLKKISFLNKLEVSAFFIIKMIPRINFKMINRLCN